MNILVTGANGQLGQCIRTLVQKQGNGHPDHTTNEANYYIFAGHDELDITDAEKVREYVTKNFINVIINCAAFTAVDNAEDNFDSAYKINAVGPKNLANAVKSNGGVLIHISTDYVFDGNATEPYKPTSKTEPQTTYGLTKLRGEEEIINSGLLNYIIIRTSWLYSEYGKNFLKTIFKKLEEGKTLNVVSDQLGVPTYAMDLARFILHIIEDNTGETRYLSKTGIWHFSNNYTTPISWWHFASEIETCEYNKVTDESRVIPCGTDEYPTKAKRPKFSALDISDTIRDFDYDIRQWDAAVKECVDKLKENGNKME